MTKMPPPRTVPARKPWTAPAVQRIAAGQAELSTRPSNSDGPFSVS